MPRPTGSIPGGKYAGPGKPPQDAHVETFTYRNVEVLNALQKLTGEDFGYDVAVLARLGHPVVQPPSQALPPRAAAVRGPTE